MACHQHRPYKPDEVQEADRGSINPDYKPDAAATYDPQNFPASRSARTPNGRTSAPTCRTSRPSSSRKPQGLKWLANWIHAPEKYHPKSLMPNLQLSFEDAADIASWIISVPGEWPVKVEVAGPTRPR